MAAALLMGGDEIEPAEEIPFDRDVALLGTTITSVVR
jgi:hypothetical protein